MQIIRETISSCFASDLENDVTFTANCQLVHKPLPRLLGVLGPQQTQTMFWNQQIRPWLLYQLLGAQSWGGTDSVRFIGIVVGFHHLGPVVFGRS